MPLDIDLTSDPEDRVTVRITGRQTFVVGDPSIGANGSGIITGEDPRRLYTDALEDTANVTDIPDPNGFIDPADDTRFDAR